MPENKCGYCEYWNRCKALIGSLRPDSECDFSPSRFKPRQPEPPKYDALPDCDPEVIKAQEAIARIMQERDKATKKRVLENVLLVLQAELAKAQNRGELEVIKGLLRAIKAVEVLK